MQQYFKAQHDVPKSRNLPMRLGERYGEIKYRGGRVIQCLHTPDSLICRRDVEYDSGH